jgi:hypothetical protein
MKNIKDLCDKYDECKENKLFHPFCYKIGPSMDDRYRVEGNFKFQRSGRCWAILTGKTYWVEVPKDE